MTICMFEDDKFKQFLPLTYLRPVATLRAGIVPLYARAQRHFPQSRTVLAVRDAISPVTAHTHHDIPVNIIKREENEDVLFVNGRIRSWGDLPRLVAETRLTSRFINQNAETVAVLFKAPMVNHTSKVTTPAEYQALYEKESKEIPDSTTTATLYGHLWDIVADIDSEIRADFAHLLPAVVANARIHTGAFVVNSGQTRLCDGVEVMPGAVIDASGGPVYIGANTRVEAHAAIYGPCAIGPNCIVGAGKYSGLSIGHTSRIGGEIEESVFQSYVNKYHAGFIGHCYVGSWVNFGAMTTNSDLKNNYSTIRVQVNGESADTGSIKVGSFIGDHTKFGIGTLLNTGIVIGVACNVFGGTLISEKEVPSFRWGNSAGWETHQFEKAVDTAAKTMERRKQTLSGHESAALKLAFDNSAPDEGCLRFA
jgi:UDP-N-acetylglucosamine diphosphorylase/glucosamine-1-phosphate N-acetyltransferase